MHARKQATLDDLEQRARRLVAVLEETQDPQEMADIERELREIELARSDLAGTEHSQVRGIGAHPEGDASIRGEITRRTRPSESAGGKQPPHHKR